jgi:hypothetical protein
VTERYRTGRSNERPNADAPAQEGIKVHVKPEVQAKLDQLVRESGRPCNELLEDAIIGYFDELMTYP